MYKYKLIIYFFVIAAIAFFINSCQESSIAPPTIQNPVINDGAYCPTANLFCGSPGSIKVANGCGTSTVGTAIKLWAGVGNSFTGGVEVGYVDLSTNSGGQLIVKYIITNSSFQPKDLHFDIATTKETIKLNNKGNPVPGKFPYTFSGSPNGNVYEFAPITLPTVPPYNSATGYFIAAHAGGTLNSTPQCFNGLIPTGCVTVSNIHNEMELGSYFNFVLANAGTLTGTYNGWCIDLAHVHQGIPFNCAKLYSSLNPSTIPAEHLGFPHLDHPEDFDKVNYLLNHYKVGLPVGTLTGNCSTYTAAGNILPMDIQAVIWYLMDERPQDIAEWVNGPLLDWAGLYSMDRIKAILCDVMTNGEGFVPNCANGDLVSIIVIPDGESLPFTVQPVLFTVPCNCGTDVTAWGDGQTGGTFTNSTWATYFKWLPVCP